MNMFIAVMACHEHVNGS